MHSLDNAETATTGASTAEKLMATAERARSSDRARRALALGVLHSFDIRSRTTHLPPPTSASVCSKRYRYMAPSATGDARDRCTTRQSTTLPSTTPSAATGDQRCNTGIRIHTSFASPPLIDNTRKRPLPVCIVICDSDSDDGDVEAQPRTRPLPKQPRSEQDDSLRVDETVLQLPQSPPHVIIIDGDGGGDDNSDGDKDQSAPSPPQTPPATAAPSAPDEAQSVPTPPPSSPPSCGRTRTPAITALPSRRQSTPEPPLPPPQPEPQQESQTEYSLGQGIADIEAFLEDELDLFAGVDRL